MSNRPIAHWLAIAILAASALPLAACQDTVIFGAQREIDLAASVNEDTAEPVVVNIGLNSQMAGLVPPISHKTGEDTPNTALPGAKPLPNQQQVDDLFGVKRPEGEAASIFSGFHYISALGVSLQPGQPPIQFQAEIRSQFASGAAAVILAGNPIAVKHVVDVDNTFDRGANFATAEHIARLDAVHTALGKLTDANVTKLYQTPLSHEPGVDKLIADYIAFKGGSAACDASMDCQRSVVLIRVDNADPVSGLGLWEAAIKNPV